MGPGDRGLSQHHLHVADVGGHGLRHGERAGIGERGGEGAHAPRAVIVGHDGVFQHPGDELERPVRLIADVAGDLRPQLLGRGVQTHIVVDLPRNLREGIVSQRRVEAGLDRDEEVAQRPGGEPRPQVHRHRQRHRPHPVVILPPLLFRQDPQQRRRQIFRDGDLIAVGLFPQPVYGEKAHRDVEGVKRLCQPPVGIGPPHQRQPPGRGAGVADVGVLQLLGAGRLLQRQHAALRRNGRAGLAQILRQQRAEKDQRARAVRQRVERLHGDAVPIVVEPHQPAVVLVEADRLAGVGHVRLEERAGSGVRLEVVPEKAPPDAHGKAGEAGHHRVDGVLQGGGHHRLGHHGGKTVNGGILLPLERGVQHARVVQPIPASLFLHGASPPPVGDGYSVPRRAGRRKGKPRAANLKKRFSFAGIVVQ